MKKKVNQSACKMFHFQMQDIQELVVAQEQLASISPQGLDL